MTSFNPGKAIRLPSLNNIITKKIINLKPSGVWYVKGPFGGKPIGAYAWFKNPTTGLIEGARYYPDLVNSGKLDLPVFKNKRRGLVKPNISEKGIPSHLINFPKKVKKSWRGNNMGVKGGIKRVATSVSRVKQPRVRNRLVTAAERKYDFLIKKTASTKTKIFNLRIKNQVIRGRIKKYDRMIKESPSTVYAGSQRQRSYYRSKLMNENQLKVNDRAIQQARQNIKDINLQKARVTRRLKYLTTRNKFGGIRSGIKRGISRGLMKIPPVKRAYTRIKRPDTVKKQLSSLRAKFKVSNDTYVGSIKQMAELKSKANSTTNVKSRVKYRGQMDDIRRSDKFRRSKQLRSQYRIRIKRLEIELAELKKRSFYSKLRGKNNFGPRFVKRAAGKLAKPIRGAITNVKRPKVIDKQLRELKPYVNNIKKVYNNAIGEIAQLRRKGKTSLRYNKLYKESLRDPVLKQYRTAIPFYEKQILKLEQERMRLSKLTPFQRMRGKGNRFGGGNDFLL